jgi:hypothetical protein
VFYINVQISHICDSPFYLYSDGWALQDDPNLQGLLEEEGEHEAIYPNVMAELQGVPMEDDFEDCPAMVLDNEPYFWVMATRALKNVGID